MNADEPTYEEEAAPSVQSSIGAALTAGTLASVIAAVPASLRVASPWTAWVVLAGATAAVLGPAVAGLRRLSPLGRKPFSALVALGLSALPIAILAAKLKALTHHRPLGAVALGVGAIVILLGTAAVIDRITAWTAPPRVGRAARAWILSSLAWLALAAPALLVGSTLSAEDARASVLDVGLSVGCAILLARVPWPTPLLKVVSRAGLPVWASLVLGALLVAALGVHDSARDASPALLAPFGWFID